LINRRAYADLVQGGPIDIALSPAQVSIGTLLTYVRHGDVAQVHSLRRGAAEALEIVAHGDQKNSKVVGRRESVTCRRFAVHSSPPSSAISEQPKIFNFFRLGMKKQNRAVLIAHKDVVIETGRPRDHLLPRQEGRQAGGETIRGWLPLSSSGFSRW
jgi:trk system potassium uptake protein TrkA